MGNLGKSSPCPGWFGSIIPPRRGAAHRCMLRGQKLNGTRLLLNIDASAAAPRAGSQEARPAQNISFPIDFPFPFTRWMEKDRRVQGDPIQSKLHYGDSKNESGTAKCPRGNTPYEFWQFLAECRM